MLNKKFQMQMSTAKVEPHVRQSTALDSQQLLNFIWCPV